MRNCSQGNHTTGLFELCTMEKMNTNNKQIINEKSNL